MDKSKNSVILTHTLCLQMQNGVCANIDDNYFPGVGQSDMTILLVLEALPMKISLCCVTLPTCSASFEDH